MKLKLWGTPGTGKTFNLLNYYTKFLNEGYTTENITLITFRKNAAEDLIKKVGDNNLKKHV